MMKLWGRGQCLWSSEKEILSLARVAETPLTNLARNLICQFMPHTAMRAARKVVAYGQVDSDTAAYFECFRGYFGRLKLQHCNTMVKNRSRLTKLKLTLKNRSEGQGKGHPSTGHEGPGKKL